MINDMTETFFFSFQPKENICGKAAARKKKVYESQTLKGTNKTLNDSQINYMSRTRKYIYL